MSIDTTNRSKYWWIWPEFKNVKDAIDAAKMGVLACSLIAGITGMTFFLRYYSGGGTDHLLVGLTILIIYSILGYGIFRMSRVAAIASLLLFLIEKTYGYIITGASLGVAPLIAWYLFQGNRAIFWFNGDRSEEKISPPRIPKPPSISD